VGKKDNAPDRIFANHTPEQPLERNGPSAGVHAEAVISSDAWGAYWHPVAHR
jgi:hypothetical protein